jgi:hypothetical protein
VHWSCGDSGVGEFARSPCPRLCLRGCHEDFDLEEFDSGETGVEYSYYERFGEATLLWADACIALQKEKDMLRKMIKLEEQVYKDAQKNGDAAEEFQAFANLALYKDRLDETEGALDACREMFSQFFN